MMARKQFSMTVVAAPGGGRPSDGDTVQPTRALAALEEPTEAIQTHRVAATDGWAGSLDQLFRRQAPRLLRYLSRRVAAREEAADLVQESFLQLVRITSRQDPPQRPEAYLQRIARNLLLNRARQALARGEHLHAPLEEDALPSGEPDPEEVLSHRELEARYEAALAALSPKTREVFLLHRRDGYTYPQIASELKQSVSNVEKHMMKAIAHLDRVLERTR